MIVTTPVPLGARLALARSVAWWLLLSGWVGLGSVAMVLAPNVEVAFALVAAWLLALGVAATIATHDHLGEWIRRPALAVGGALTAASLVWSTRGGGLAALLVALAAWAALTALASGVVRQLRLAQALQPRPPIGPASLGALFSALALGDLGDLQALTLRLGALVIVAVLGLSILQVRGSDRVRASRCRAGLFDCSLPAWPAGAWRDARQWPALLAGLAMLPMMAALPLMAAWCRAEQVPSQALVLLHFAAMFGPALLLRRSIVGWSTRALATVCTGLLAAGAILAFGLEAPFNLFALALAHGAAWGLAWAGQLWAPDRRSRSGTSPLRSAIGYALLTLVFGVLVGMIGVAGVTATHALLGGAAVLAWLWGSVLRPDPADADEQHPVRHEL